MIKDEKRCIQKTNGREKGEIEQVTREEYNRRREIEKKMLRVKNKEWEKEKDEERRQVGKKMREDKIKDYKKKRKMRKKEDR